METNEMRVVRALLSYARTAPLDLLSAREIKQNLLAIAGQPHAYRASIGSDACYLCLCAPCNPVHTNVSEADWLALLAERQREKAADAAAALREEDGA